MTINRTTLLGLPLPVTGTESGAWGDVTNNGLSQYIDTSVAGALSITGTVTLANTLGDASATNLGATTAQYRTLIIPASGPSANIVITAPSSNRTYHVINRNATYTVQIRAGANSGVTLAVNQSATVSYDSVAGDYVLVGGNVVGPASATDNAVVRFDGTTGKLVQNSVVTIADSTGDVAGVGALTMGGNLTLSGGTANGVLYLNGSKVATSGSALTFDGSTQALAASGYGVYRVSGGSAGGGYFETHNNSGTRIGSFGSENGGDMYLGTRVNNPIIFLQNNSEAMRLTSTGLGIGTSSPSQKLEILTAVSASTPAAIFRSAAGVGNTGGLAFYANDTNANARNWYLVANSNVYGDFVIKVGASQGANPTSGNTVATLDSSGNLGLGVTPSVYTANSRVFQVDGGANATELKLTNNTTGNAGGDGTLLQLNGLAAYFWNLENSFLSFGTNNTERARITSGGDLLVGATAQISNERLSVTATSTNQALYTKNNSTDYNFNCWNAATTGDNPFIQFITETAATSRGGITYNRAGGLVAYNITSDYRAKDIIGPLTDSGAVIDALKVYEGVMKGATQSRPMLIAHEAQAHAPYAVSGVKDEVNENGTPKFQQMDVSSLVPLLLAEIQSLRQRVALLEGN